MGALFHYYILAGLVTSFKNNKVFDLRWYIQKSADLLFSKGNTKYRFSKYNYYNSNVSLVCNMLYNRQESQKRL